MSKRNLLEDIGAAIDELVRDTRALIERSRRGELPVTRIDPQEPLGPCTVCGAVVVPVTGIRFADGPIHEECSEAQLRDRRRLLAAFNAYLGAAKTLTSLAGEPMAELLREVGAEVARPATHADLEDALRKLAHLVLHDPRVSPQHREPAGAAIRHALSKLRGAAIRGD